MEIQSHSQLQRFSEKLVLTAAFSEREPDDDLITSNEFNAWKQKLQRLPRSRAKAISASRQKASGLAYPGSDILLQVAEMLAAQLKPGLIK